jgi:hypothetical protein
MPDAWEIANGFNPNDPSDANQDADGDGMTNLQEYSAGTDPHNAASYLRIDLVGTGPAVLQFNAAADKTYTIEYKDQIETVGWSKLTDVPAGGARPVQVTDPTARPHRFYRLRTPQAP